MKIRTHSIYCLLLLSGMLLFLGGCRKSVLREQEPGLSPEDTALVDAVLILRYSEMQTKAADRETQEQQVNDLNLFFVHKSYPSAASPEVRHYYFSSSDMAKHIKLTNIRLGRYTMYAVANAGEKLCSDSHDLEHPSAVGDGLCSMTEAQIMALVADNWEADLTRADNLPMSSVDPDMAVKRSDEGVLPTITISLERKVAKYEFSYELVGAAKGKMTISSLAAKYVPGRVSMFEDNTLLNENYYNSGVSPIVDFPVPSGIDMVDPVTFYMPENMQGTVAGIASQKDRNGQNAPKCASYLYLDGNYEGNQYGFSIYLGDDMEGGNFDVNGNGYYRMHLQLGGPDPDDIRISSLKFDVQERFNSSIKLNEETFAIVEIICSNYFNDQLTLICSATGALGERFKVFALNEDGSTGEEFTDVTGRFWYNVLLTDTTPGQRKVKCKIVYSQSQMATPISMQLMLRTRYGTISLLNPPPTITVRP